MLSCSNCPPPSKLAQFPLAFLESVLLRTSVRTPHTWVDPSVETKDLYQSCSSWTINATQLCRWQSLSESWLHLKWNGLLSQTENICDFFIFLVRWGFLCWSCHKVWLGTWVNEQCQKPVSQWQSLSVLASGKLPGRRWAGWFRSHRKLLSVAQGSRCGEQLHWTCHGQEGALWSGFPGGSNPFLPWSAQHLWQYPADWDPVLVASLADCKGLFVLVSRVTWEQQGDYQYCAKKRLK